MNIKRGNNRNVEGSCPKIVPFERDAAYYFQKGNYYLFKNNWRKALLYYKKTIEMEPLDPLNHYNLGCLLSKMGQLEEANQIFQFILEHLDRSYWDCYFLMAINYGLMEDLEEAQRCLQKYLQNSPGGEMFIEAQELLWALDDEEMVISDDVDVPFIIKKNEELIEDIQILSKDEFISRYDHDDYTWDLLRKLLFQGNDMFKKKIIDIYAELGDDRAVAAFKEFVRNPWVKDQLKQAVLLKLKNIGFSGECRVYLKGVLQEIHINNYPLVVPHWKDEWQEVLDCTLNHMRQGGDYNENFFEDVQAMWIDYINRKGEDMPPIHKVETWAAGLEYCLVRFHLLNVTQTEIAGKYGVSSSSVRAKFKVIDETLQIDKKAYQNMLVYLFNGDREK
ncbi:MAG: tetratricopeptide repeat protein [Firmicutes bacterium]|nr:tetratricopeptide repeat protein [Bacillota bacterium]